MIVFLGATGRLNLFYPKPFPLEWADIPTRVFIMGSSPGTADAHLDEFPQHQVYLTAYQINRYLITNKQYLQCVQLGICGKPSGLIEISEKADHPVVNVTLSDAQTFCE
jgi:formylglycine-generating enzyme required for sulfatase activity